MIATRLFVSLIAFSCCYLLSSPGEAKDYKLGTVFRDIIEIDFFVGKKSAPLPPGKWELVSKYQFRTRQSNIPIIHFYLISRDEKKITGIASVVTPKEFVEYAWGDSRICSKKRRSRAWYSEVSSYDKFEDCNIIYPRRRLNRNFKPFKGMLDYIDANQLVMPGQSMAIRFARSKDEEMLQVNYLLSLEYFGFRSSSNWRDWRVSRIRAFPDKVAFMEDAIAWTQSWKTLIDKGFKNKLRRADVAAHPRIANRAPSRTNESPDAKPYDLSAFLTAEQVKKLYSGAEFKATSRSGGPVRARYHADGTYNVDIDGRSMNGKWWVKESGEYCFENDNGASGCWLTKYLGENRYQNINKFGRKRVVTLIEKQAKQTGAKPATALHSNSIGRPGTSSEIKENPANPNVAAAVRPEVEIIKTTKQKNNYLSREQIKKSFVSRSFDTTLLSGAVRTIQFEENGSLLGKQISGRGLGVPDVGNWSINKSNQICMRWDRWYASRKECFHVKKSKGEFSLFGSGGQAERTLTQASVIDEAYVNKITNIEGTCSSKAEDSIVTSSIRIKEDCAAIKSAIASFYNDGGVFK